jgi:cobalt/nickel transport system ATP-binding protein
VTTPVLDLRGVAYAYPGGHQALFGVDLHVHPGERVALLGPNGAGKTTLVLHLNGVLTPGHGTVLVSGMPVTDPLAAAPANWALALLPALVAAAASVGARMAA